MRKKTVPIILMVICIVMLSVAASAGDGRHWVDEELVGFKELIISCDNEIIKEELEKLQSAVFGEEQLDEPISLQHWAALVNLALRPDKDGSGRMLDFYVYGLGTGDKITREDAVGGLVKLLTIDYLSGSSTYEELKPSLALTDLEMISDRQVVLVQKAYCEGILDAQTIDLFRPKDYLTNAEAVSMLYRVIKKYNIKLYKEHPTSHWANTAVTNFANAVKGQKEISAAFNKITEAADILNEPINTADWNNLLMYICGLTASTYDQSFLESYTYGLSENGFIRRDKAVAGMVKLLHAAEFVKGRDATGEELLAVQKRFNDVNEVFDNSKLAIAYYEGLIQGYQDGSFRPYNTLTNAEAIALLSRIMEKYVK
ncbi:MAG: S-layer homology domain-containing protein [Bacillota bacterium]